MKKTGLLVISLWLLLSCQEDYYPPGFRGDQVTWMLAADSNRTWTLVRLIDDGTEMALEDCTDSVRFYLNWESTSQLDAYELTYQPDCQTFDSVYYGQLMPSTSDPGELFTDSLLFEEGTLNYLIVEEIDPDRVVWKNVPLNQTMVLRWDQ